MTTRRDHRPVDDNAFDRTLQVLHAQAVSHVSARTRAQLQQRLRAVTTSSRPVAGGHRRWAAGMAIAVAVLSIAYIDVTRWHPHNNGSPAIATADAGQPDVLAVIDEPPDLYLWLASDDARQFAME